ncbi:hypothetical protein MMC20_007345 [Loxospora ochrophaea]|nr:hypothetical protein [Loxospora ochrophaea]
MYFSKTTFVTSIVALTTLSEALPSDGVSNFRRATDPFDGTMGTTLVVNHLDTNGHLDWTNTDGGRMTSISPGLIAAAKQNISQNALQKRSGVGSYTNAGQIADFAAQYACESSGEWGISSTIESAATNACNNFLSSLPGAPVVQGAWQIWQSAVAPDATGGSETTNFRWQWLSSSAPSLTMSICQTAYSDLTSVYCQGKGDKGTDTQGGTIQVGNNGDYLEIGFDPNSA